MDCLFCKIAAGELPCHKLYEDDRTLAFLDIFPGTVGHTLIIPKRHAADLFELPDGDLNAIMATAAKVAPILMGMEGVSGLNLHQSNGEAAGQVIFHYHLHLLPRRDGDDLRSPWQAAKGDETRLRELAGELRAALEA